MFTTKEVLEFINDEKVICFSVGLIIPLLLYIYTTRKSNYWKRRGIKYVPPRSTFLSSDKKPAQDEEIERYNQLGRVYGSFDSTFSSREPALNVGEPKLLRDILVKDFSVFPNRRDPASVEGILSKFLSTLKGEDWKRVRSVVSPTFSTGKIRRLIGIFKECSKTLLQNFKMSVQKGKPIEVKRLYGAFTMDVIASASFSTKIDSHNDPQNEFVRTAMGIFQARDWRYSLIRFLPKIFRRPLSRLGSDKMDFFKSATLQIIAERKRTGQTRNDFLQLLLDAATQVSEEEKKEEAADIAENYGDDATSHPVFKSAQPKRLSMDELVAQCVIFFLAGYHTSSLTLSFATYFLAVHQDVQEKVFKEITEVLKETNGELTSEAIEKMKYLDNVISETLRLYPVAYKLERIAEADYKLGDTGIVVPKGMVVNIPVYAMHRDPQFFQDPERFDPDRFSPEQRVKQVPYSYLPFGSGPRICVGMRFALMEIKVGLVHVISAFQIKRSPLTKVPLEFRRSTTILSPKDIIVEMEFRPDCPLKE